METIDKKISRKASIREVDRIVVRFSGDSGDGMQLTGLQFTDTAALMGNDLSTFPDFPSEIRAPIGTVAGVSGFQVHLGSTEIYTPGDRYDVLVAMNAAALKVDLAKLKPGGIIIANAQGFDAKKSFPCKISCRHQPPGRRISRSLQVVRYGHHQAYTGLSCRFRAWEKGSGKVEKHVCPGTAFLDV